jgi:hypothetical protein
MAFHIECERIWVLDSLQAIHSDDGKGDGVRIVSLASQLAGGGAGAGATSPISNVLGLLLPSKRQMVGVANEIYDGLAKSAGVARRDDRMAVFNYGEYVAGLSSGYEI